MTSHSIATGAHTRQEIITEHLHEGYSKTVLGFWIFIMTDCILFTSLFASYLVLHAGTNGGPTSEELYDLSTALAETMILLTSSFACGLGAMATFHNHKTKVLGWFALTFILGLSFVIMEVDEFSKMVSEGNSWQRSAFLSGYFTLVGTHGLHVSIGLLWIAIMFPFIIARGLTLGIVRKLACFSMYWHFLDVVWIFIFTVVYLMGKVI